MSVSVKFKKLRDDAVIPAYAHEGDSGFDFYLPKSTVPITIYPGRFVKIPLGLAVEIPYGFELQLRAKSGLSEKSGIFMVNGVGTVDAGYRGEIAAIVGNFGQMAKVFSPGDKVCQGVIAAVECAEIVETIMLSDSARGSGGFGSTGSRCDKNSCRGL